MKSFGITQVWDYFIIQLVNGLWFMVHGFIERGFLPLVVACALVSVFYLMWVIETFDLNFHEDY